MEELYNSLVETLNYGWITLFMAVESSFIPFPSEVVIIPAAFIAATQGTLSLPLIILFGTLGAIVGALVNYGLAFWLGRPIIHRFADTTLAHMLLIDRPGVEKAEKYFADHGAVGTFVGRLIPAIRQLISIPAGLAKMNLVKFIGYTALGAGIWNTILAILGYTVGQTIGEEALKNKVHEYSNYVVYGIAAIVAVGFCYYVYLVAKANKTAKRRNIDNAD